LRISDWNLGVSEQANRFSFKFMPEPTWLDP